ncbi:MAG: deoR, partial [Oscillospiraceae bacterium]|nr:deoR [Oscillospiraceae bacterium]
MLIEERYAKIRELLIQNQSVKVPILTELFGVSIETVRRDLEYLEKQGLLKRVHGGAVLPDNHLSISPRIFREYMDQEQKKEIARIACRFIKEGQAIALDTGTTNNVLAREMKNHFEKLIVITNSIAVINELSDKPSFTLIVPGGTISHDELAIVGDMTVQYLNNFHVESAFVCMSGISIENGLTDFGVEEVKAKQKIISIAKKVYVLADSQKFETVSLMKAC